MARTYYEYGLAGPWSLSAQISGARQRARGPGYDQIATGIGEAEVSALRHFNREGGTVVAGRLTGILETSKFIRGQRALGQDAGVGLGVLIGRGGEGGFSQVSADLRQSFGDDAEQVRLQATSGIKGERGTLLGEVFQTWSLPGTADGGLDYDLTQVGASVISPRWRGLNLQVGVRTDIASRNLQPGTAGFVSLWWWL